MTSGGNKGKRPRLAKWEAGTLKDSLARVPERCEEFRFDSGAPVERVYTPEHLASWDAGTALGMPGEPPFTRGIQPTMYRGRFWTMRQYSGFGDARETNRRLRYLLDRGQTGLSIAFDLPTQMGYDSDHAMAAGEVGRVGVAIDSIEDMETLLDGLPLDGVSTSMTINATAAILLALYAAVGKRRGVPLDRLSGTVQNDVLKEYIARGTYIYPPEGSLRLATDIFAWGRQAMPRFNVISVSGYHIREAGSTAAQEIAFTFANGLAYLEAARARGLPIEEIAGQISFFFNAHNNFVEEIAKFRAARRLWGRLLERRFGVTDPVAQRLRFHAQTGGSTLTAQQPENNIARVAVQALAAVLGGAQSLHTNGMDEALALPTEKAATIALRTQQILAHETGVADTVDPFGGAYALEAATDRLEAEATALLEAIDRIGGTVRAIEAGYQQKEIQEAAYRAQQQAERGERIVVGVNRYQDAAPGEAVLPTLKVDPALEESQRERVRALKAGRDQRTARQALDEVERAARGDQNLMPLLVAAVEAKATLGEISDRLRAAFGAYAPRERIA
ncbi:MAG TPA: methylmalonyl-CoA mutase family protein [Candidatus Polarisedimenticolia bacterium]|nr:methylmalonyl-CoA mutase family protein [Candidatus Polarisedimenticolia bacterium]